MEISKELKLDIETRQSELKNAIRNHQVSLNFSLFFITSRTFIFSFLYNEKSLINKRF